MKKRKLFNLRYPKIIILILLIIIAYFVFKQPAVSGFVTNLNSLSYLGIFIAGMLIAFGFSAPFAVGFFITLNPSNIWLVGLIGGIGAATTDLIIFKCIKFSFKDEFDRLKNTKTLKKFNTMINHTCSRKVKLYLMYIFAEILIATPLPDEAGVTIIAGLTKVKQWILAVSSFILHTIAIIIILSL